MGITLVGQPFPAFSKKAVVSLEKGKEVETISNKLHTDNQQWMVMFFWPKDFSSLCPTELIEFNKAYEGFKERGTVLVGASTDSEFVHLAWRKNNEDLRNVQYPLLADTSKSLARELGILTGGDEVCYRATFIVDPLGNIRWVCVNDLAIGRNVNEVLRVLDALQTGGLCPCNWDRGQATL